MSVDRRIREGLGMTNTELPDTDTSRALVLVTTRARKATRRRRLVVSGVAAAAAAAAVAVAVSVTGDDNAGQPPPADRTPSQSPDAGGPVVTVWGSAYLSDPVTFDDMAQNLREHGLGEWVEPLHDRWGDVDGQIRLDFDGQQMTASIPGTPASHSNGGVLVDAGRPSLVFQYPGGQPWTVFEAPATELDAGGQRLTMKLIQPGAAPPIDGIPGEVYERALYTTVPFNEILLPSEDELSPGTYVSDPLRFGGVATDLRIFDLGSSVEPLREMWGGVDGPVQVRLELDGDTATTSIPGTDLTFTGPYAIDGSLVRLEDDDPRDDNGWIELVSSPPEFPDVPPGDVQFRFWDAGPAAWDGVPAKGIALALFGTANFTATAG